MCEDILCFVYFGVRMNDYVKTMKLTTYKLLFDFMFQRYEEHDWGSLNEYLHERTVLRKPNKYLVQKYPGRITKTEFTMRVNQTEVLMNELPPTKNRISVREYSLHTVASRAESLRSFQISTPEVRVFGQQLSFGESNLMMTLNDCSFAQKKLKGVFYSEVRREGVLAQSDGQVPSVRNPLHDIQVSADHAVLHGVQAKAAQPVGGTVPQLLRKEERWGCAGVADHE